MNDHYISEFETNDELIDASVTSFDDTMVAALSEDGELFDARIDPLSDTLEADFGGSRESLELYFGELAAVDYISRIFEIVIGETTLEAAIAARYAGKSLVGVERDEGATNFWAPISDVEYTNGNVSAIRFLRIFNGNIRTYTLDGEGWSHNDVAMTSDIFIARYNTTSYAAIQNAKSSGKHIILKVNDNTFALYAATVTTGSLQVHSFYRLLSAGIISYQCDSTNRWSNSTSYLQSTGSKVNAIDENSTNLEYPSAKAVYEAIKNAETANTLTLGTTADTAAPGNHTHTVVNGHTVESDVPPNAVFTDTDSAFVAKYGTTSYLEILNAYTAGKAIFCVELVNNNNKYIRVYKLNYIDNSTVKTAYFSLYHQAKEYAAKCSEANGWESMGTASLQLTSDRTGTISSSSTATQYPSAKAVYDIFHSNEVEASETNGNIKIGGTETAVYIHPNGTNPHGTTKTDIGLGNVTNNAQVKGLESGTTEDHIVTWGADGHSVKDSGFTIGKSVPSDAEFTDTVSNFVAVYGTTTFTKIKEAHDAGKDVSCTWDSTNKRQYDLAYITSTTATFTLLYSDRLYSVTCSTTVTENNGWKDGGYFSIQKTSNLVKTVDSASTDDKYPSAKAVYDAMKTIDVTANINVFENIVCIGDSYLRGEHGDAIASNDNWGQHLKTLLGSKNKTFHSYSDGGSGFCRQGLRGKKFSNLLDEAATDISSEADRKAVTLLLVGGGWNDKFGGRTSETDDIYKYGVDYTGLIEEGEDQLTQAVSSFIDSAKTYFPNARIVTLCLGTTGEFPHIIGEKRDGIWYNLRWNSTEQNYLNIKVSSTQLREKVISSYHDAAIAKGCECCTNAWQYLYTKNGMLVGSDKIHPTSEGYKRLANAIFEFVMNGEKELVEDFTSAVTFGSRNGYSFDACKFIRRGTTINVNYCSHANYMSANDTFFIVPKGYRPKGTLFIPSTLFNTTNGVLSNGVAEFNNVDATGERAGKYVNSYGLANPSALAFIVTSFAYSFV